MRAGRDWDTCEDPVKLLELARGVAGVRQIRLAMAFVARRAEHAITEPLCRQAIGALTRYVRGQVNEDELNRHFEGLFARQDQLGDWWWLVDEPPSLRGMEAVMFLALEALFPCTQPPQPAARRQEQRVWCDALRDIFGSYLHPHRFHPSWRTSTTTAIAAAIDAFERFEELPVLADALEEAGCDDSAVLRHCREGGTHQHGCWVIEHVLGRLPALSREGWLKAEDATAMLSGLPGLPTDRKLRLFACGCCRWMCRHFEVQDTQREIIEAVERFVDGQARDGDESRFGNGSTEWDYDPRYWPIGDLSRVDGPALGQAIAVAGGVVVAFGEVRCKVALDGTAQLLQDVLGDPFEPVRMEVWRSQPVRELAQAIYDHHAFERMPELADLLEEAGCENDRVLEHCRGGEHARGCWVLDGLLGKS